jgi:hypothetical protein
LSNEIFVEMLSFYEQAIPCMGFLGETQWCSAAIVTFQRVIEYLHQGLKESPENLARECHADLQGFVQVNFEIDLMETGEISSDEDLSYYFELNNNLVAIGGYP